jgi:prepilin signal peptidase PulO-like enzyme (type II secretory pathway)
VAGAVGLTVMWWAFLLACLAALIATPFRRDQINFAFGPWLAAGAVLAIAMFA